MAIQDIIVRLKMAATGVDQQVKNSEQIADNYARANTNAQKLGAQQARAAAYSGSRSPRETVEYGMARGAAGATGASARDFANQAQGLGGLVRLYATYAANIFAVSAAFRALSDAMNTANMVRGLDQLGAASGRALGNLSKQLVEVTDGAISLRDSMTAVAQTSAAGMSSQNILRLGAAAQKASQALGLNMADALNRLSRGITKLEPELLDELGVFIRIDDAAEKYARTLGKTTASLTEFERRQGFALAVLEQLDDKFGKIKLDTNPYDKLAASLDNLAKKVLDFVNIGLGPIVNFLAQSQAALGAALLGLGTIVLRQALPVLTQYREGLKKTREASLATAAETSGALAKQQIDNMKKALRAFEDIEEKKIDAADAAQKKYETLQKKYAQDERKTFDARIKTILGKQATDVTGEDLAYIDKKAAQTEKANKKMAASYKEIGVALNEAKVAALASEKARQDKAAAEADYEKKYGNSLQKNLDLRQQLTKAARDDLAVKTATAAKDQGYFSALKAGFSQVAQQRKELAVDIPILDKDGKQTGQSSKLIVNGLSRVEAGLAGVRVAASATGQFLAGLLSRLGAIGIAVSIGVAAFEFFNSMLSNSEKENQKYKKSQDLLAGSIENVANTLEAIRNKKPDQILSVESVQARANAFNDLSDALIKTVKDFDKLIDAQGTWERGLDRVARFFGKDLGDFGKGLLERDGFNITGSLAVGASKVSEAIFGKGKQAEFSDKFAESISSALALAETEVERSKLTTALQNILGTEIDLDNIEKLKQGINDLDMSDLRTKSDLAAKAIKKISDEANISASNLTSLKESIKTVSKEIDGLNTSLLPTDRLGKIGVGFIDVSSNLVKSLNDTKNGVVGIKEVSDSMQLMSLLPADIATSLIQDKKYISDVTAQLGEAREAIRGYKEELAKLPKEGGTEEQQIKRKSLQDNLSRRENIASDLETKAAGIVNKYSVQLQRVIFEEGIQKLNASLKFGMEQAAISSAKAYVGVLGQVGGATAQAETKLALQELNIQKRLIEEQYQSRLALERNTVALEKSTTAQEITALNAKIAGQKTGATAEDTLRYQKLMEKRQTLDEKQALLDNPTIKKLEEARKTGSDYQKRAAMELGGLTSVMFGKQIQLAQIAGQEAQILAQNILKSERELADQANKRIDISLKDNQIKLDELTTNQNLLGMYDSGLAAQRLNLETTILQQNAQKELNRLVADESILQQLKGKPGVDEKKREEALRLVLEQKAATASKYIQDDTNLRKKARLDEFKNLEEIAKKERENALQILQANNEIANTRLDASLQYLQVLEAFGVQDKISETQQRTKIELLKQELQFSAQLVELNNRQLDIDFKREQVKLLRFETGVEPAALVKEIDREQALLNAQRDSIIAGNDARKESIRLQAEQNVKLAEQNLFLEQAGRLSNNLSDNFGATGQRLGQALDTLAKVTKNIQDGKLAQESWNKRAEEFGDFAPPEFIEEGVRLQKKAAQDELDRNAQALSSTKKLFKEKTAAYKAFGALEKAYHIARLIMSAKEIATTLANTVSFVTNSITRQSAAATEAGVLGTKAVIKDLSEAPWPINIGVAAATAAAVAALLAGIGKTFSGKGGSGRGGVSTEDINKVQGSAMDYNSRGELVQVRDGIAGDTSAKSDSVAKSIAMIEKYTLDGMPVNDAQLQYLKLIERNTKAAALSIYGASGLRSGNIPGTTGAGTQNTLLGTIGSTGGMVAGAAGGALLGGAIASGGYLAGSAIGSFLGGSALGTLAGTFLNFALPGIGLIIGALLGKTLFSQKVTTDIQQSGLAFSGNLKDLATNIEDSVSAFVEGTQKTTTRFLFFKSSSTRPLFENVDLQTLQQGQQILDNLAPIFKASYESIIGLANEIGLAQSEIDSGLMGQEFKVNLKDLKTADEISQALGDGINAYLDSISSTLFKQFKEFKQSGEGMYETVNRVVLQFKLVSQGLQNIGVSTSYLGKTIEGYRVADLVTQAFGGLEAFIDKTEKFRRAFLTEAEQLAPIQKMVTTTLKDLGISNVDTMNEFKLLVQSIKPVTPEAARLQNTLLDLAPAFEKVYKAADDLLENLRKETINLTSTLSADEIILRDITIKTAEYVDQLAAAGKATQANIEIVAKWSKASALTQLRNNLKSIYDERKRELETNISTLKKFKDSLVDLKNALTVGTLSVLTPLEQYNTLLTQYETSLVNLRSTDITVAEAARAAFPQLTKQLLESGRSIFASSENYSKLSDKVNRDLESASNFVDIQLSTEEQTLETLQDTYGEIVGIGTNTKDAATRLSELATLYSQIATADTAKIAADIVNNLNIGKTSVDSVAAALNAQIPVITKATGEAIVTVLGNKTVDTVLSDAVSLVISDANTKATGIENAAKTGISDLKTAGNTAIEEVKDAGVDTITSINGATTKLTGVISDLTNTPDINRNITDIIDTQNRQLTDNSDLTQLVKDLKATDVITTLLTDQPTLQAYNEVLQRNQDNQELQIAGINNQVIDSSLASLSNVIDSTVSVIAEALTIISSDSVNNFVSNNQDLGSFNSQTVPYAEFWRIGGVDYSKNLEVPGRAYGGFVSANMPYMVGEVGPELFVPRTNGTIISNNQLGSTNDDEISNQEIVDAINRLTQVVAQSNMDNARAIVDGWSKNQWRTKINGAA